MFRGEKKFTFKSFIEVTCQENKLLKYQKEKYLHLYEIGWGINSLARQNIKVGKLKN